MVPPFGPPCILCPYCWSKHENSGLHCRACTIRSDVSKRCRRRPSCLITVVTMSKADPGRPDPVSLREKVWPGRTALTVHCSSAAVPVRFTMTSKPCARSWLMVVSTSDGPAGAALAVAVSPSAAAASAPAVREVSEDVLHGLPFLSACADSVVCSDSATESSVVFGATSPVARHSDLARFRRGTTHLRSRALKSSPAYQVGEFVAAGGSGLCHGVVDVVFDSA